MELDQLEPSVAVWGTHHRDVRPSSLEPNDAIHPAALVRCLAFQLESELNEERRGGRKVIDDDADMVHPLDRHAGCPRTNRTLEDRRNPHWSPTKTPLRSPILAAGP